jgi:hypothetical protein
LVDLAHSGAARAALAERGRADRSELLAVAPGQATGRVVAELATLLGGRRG